MFLPPYQRRTKTSLWISVGLFFVISLILIADSVYNTRSRVLLELVALKLRLGWLDVVKFESRVTQALEMQEDIETLELSSRRCPQAGNKRQYMMLGLATFGIVTFSSFKTCVHLCSRWWIGHRSFGRFFSPCRLSLDSYGLMLLPLSASQERLHF